MHSHSVSQLIVPNHPRYRSAVAGYTRDLLDSVTQLAEPERARLLQTLDEAVAVLIEAGFSAEQDARFTVTFELLPFRAKITVCDQGTDPGDPEAPRNAPRSVAGAVRAGGADEVRYIGRTDGTHEFVLIRHIGVVPPVLTQQTQNVFGNGTPADTVPVIRSLRRDEAAVAGEMAAADSIVLQLGREVAGEGPILARREAGLAEAFGAFEDGKLTAVLIISVMGRQLHAWLLRHGTPSPAAIENLFSELFNVYAPSVEQDGVRLFTPLDPPDAEALDRFGFVETGLRPLANGDFAAEWYARITEQTAYRIFCPPLLHDFAERIYERSSILRTLDTPDLSSPRPAPNETTVIAYGDTKTASIQYSQPAIADLNDAVQRSADLLEAGVGCVELLAPLTASGAELAGGLFRRGFVPVGLSLQEPYPDRLILVRYSSEAMEKLRAKLENPSHWLLQLLKGALPPV